MENEAAPTPEPASRDLAQHWDYVGSSPRDLAPVRLIVLRPSHLERVSLESANLDPTEGLVGDNWQTRGSRSTPDGSSNPEAQITLMSTRVLESIEPDPSRWPLAGDQFYVDLDLSEENLPAGTRLAIGEAEVEVTAMPHTGCLQFSQRFGADALRWISTHEARARRMRGMYVRIVTGGTVRVGDVVRRI